MNKSDVGVSFTAQLSWVQWGFDFKVDDGHILKQLFSEGDVVIIGFKSAAEEVSGHRLRSEAIDIPGVFFCIRFERNLPLLDEILKVVHSLA